MWGPPKVVKRGTSHAMELLPLMWRWLRSWDHHMVMEELLPVAITRLRTHTIRNRKSLEKKRKSLTQGSFMSCGTGTLR